MVLSSKFAQLTKFILLYLTFYHVSCIKQQFVDLGIKALRNKFLFLINVTMYFAYFFVHFGTLFSVNDTPKLRYFVKTIDCFKEMSRKKAFGPLPRL